MKRRIVGLQKPARPFAKKPKISVASPYAWSAPNVSLAADAAPLRIEAGPKCNARSNTSAGLQARHKMPQEGLDSLERRRGRQ